VILIVLVSQIDVTIHTDLFTMTPKKGNKQTTWFVIRHHRQVDSSDSMDICPALRFETATWPFFGRAHVMQDWGSFIHSPDGSFSIPFEQILVVRLLLVPTFLRASSTVLDYRTTTVCQARVFLFHHPSTTPSFSTKRDQFSTSNEREHPPKD